MDLQILDSINIFGENDKRVLRAVSELNTDDPASIAFDTGLSYHPGIYKELCGLSLKKQGERLSQAYENGEEIAEGGQVFECLRHLNDYGLIVLGKVNELEIETQAREAQNTRGGLWDLVSVLTARGSGQEPQPVQSSKPKTPTPAIATPTEQAPVESGPQIPQTYPLAVWEDTAYSDFAKVCGQDNYIPAEFFIESLKTVIGGIAGHLLGVEGSEVEARFYTILIGEAGSGKGTATGLARELFPASLLYTHGNPFYEGIGAFVGGFASQCGIIRKARKHPQILQVYDELSTLSDKFKIHGSGLSFLALINALYERTLPPSNIVKEDIPDLETPLHNSILGGTTPDVWLQTFGGTGVEGSGFFQRLNIIGSEEKRTVPRLIKPDLAQFSGLVEKVKALRDNPYALPITPEADALLGEWYRNLQAADPETDTGRLQVLCLRNAAHLGWLLDVGRGGMTSPAEVIRRAAKLSDYQLAMRRKYKPVLGDTPWAQIENLIIRYMQEHGVVTRSALYKAIHGERHGLKVFNSALILLENAGLIHTDKVREGRHIKETIFWDGPK